MKKSLSIYLFFLILLVVLSSKIKAADLSAISDTITTSRPSAASPLNGDVASGGTLTIFDNKSVFLASDSAKIVKNDGVFYDTALNVASQSATRTSVYLTNAVGGARNSGVDTLIVPITSKHTIQFTTATAIPGTGDLEISFPVGNATNQASPSATGFSFNNLQNTNVSISGATCNTWTVSAATGKITCTNLDAVAGSTTLTVVIGSSTIALINPTKSNAAGTADTWGITVTTLDNTGVQLDTSKVKVGTVESVTVRATIEPTLTFTIAGLANGTVISTNNSSCASGGTQTTNTGIDASSTVADLGVLSLGAISVSAQDLTISTNLSSGYTLTATSSGQLSSPGIGYRIANAQGPVTNNNTPVPAAIVAGTEAFGVHACGPDSPAGTWGTRAGTSTIYYANPSQTYYYTLASKNSSANSSKTTVVYGGTISGSSPPGLYTTVLTYVATPIF